MNPSASEALNAPAEQPTQTTPTPTPTPTPTTANETVATGWSEGLSQEHKILLEKKGFKDPGAVLESYVNLEKLLGAPRDKLLQIPDSSDRDGLVNMYNKLGRPQDKNDYEITSTNESFTEWAKDTFHELGLSYDQAKNLMEKYGEFEQTQTQTSENEYQANLRIEEGKLRMEWGAAYDQNVKSAQAAVEAFKIPPETIDTLEKAMGFNDVMRFFHTLGSKVGEHDFATGDSGPSGVMTPATAQSKISELILDKGFQKRMKEGDTGAKNEWTQLHEWAYPEYKN